MASVIHQCEIRSHVAHLQIRMRNRPILRRRGRRLLTGRLRLRESQSSRDQHASRHQRGQYRCHSFHLFTPAEAPPPTITISDFAPYPHAVFNTARFLLHPSHSIFPAILKYSQQIRQPQQLPDFLAQVHQLQFAFGFSRRNIEPHHRSDSGAIHSN
jgi:hypothetical protein